MLISPKTAIEEGWIKHPNCQSMTDWESHNFVSPNAIDFTIDRLFNISDDECVISENGKIMRSSSESIPEYAERFGPQFFGDKFWIVLGKSSVDMLSDFYVDLPVGVATTLIIRSTFNRNGMFITSGLYDSKFKGHIGCVLHNNSGGDAFIAQGTRIGQIVFKTSDSDGEYKGGYNHEQNTHWTDN